MKILIVCDRLDSKGGLESHVITQVNKLAERGHEITLYTNAISEYHREIINCENLITPWSQDCFEDLYGYIPEVVLSHPFTAFDRACDIAMKYDLPFYTTMHGLYNYGYDNSPFGRKIGSYTKKVIAVDQIVVDILLKSPNCRNDKIVLNYNGIDVDKFKHKQLDSPFQNTKMTIAVITRFQDSKDVPVRQLIEVLPEIAKTFNGLNVVFVGDGCYLDEIKEKMFKFQTPLIEVMFAGSVNNVEDYMNISDLVCASARTAIEAVSCGKNVLQMGIGSWGEFVTLDNYEDTLFNVNKYRPYTNTELGMKVTCALLSSYQDNLTQKIRCLCDIEHVIDKLELVLKGGV